MSLHCQHEMTLGTQMLPRFSPQIRIQTIYMGPAYHPTWLSVNWHHRSHYPTLLAGKQQHLEGAQPCTQPVLCASMPGPDPQPYLREGFARDDFCTGLWRMTKKKLGARGLVCMVMELHEAAQEGSNWTGKRHRVLHELWIMKSRCCTKGLVTTQLLTFTVSIWLIVTLSSRCLLSRHPCHQTTKT